MVVRRTGQSKSLLVLIQHLLGRSQWATTNRDQGSAVPVASNTVPPSPAPSLPVSGSEINPNQPSNDDETTKKAEARLMKNLKTRRPKNDQDRNEIEWEAIGVLSDLNLSSRLR